MQRTPKSAIGKTPFSFVYGSEAVIPIKIIQPTIKSGVNNEYNRESYSIDLILLEEKREKVVIKWKLKEGSFKTNCCQTKKFQHKRFGTKEGPRL